MKFSHLYFLFYRFTGTIVGVEDADSNRWKNSKWRCLKVVFKSLMVVCITAI